MKCFSTWRKNITRWKEFSVNKGIGMGQLWDGTRLGLGFRFGLCSSVELYLSRHFPESSGYQRVRANFSHSIQQGISSQGISSSTLMPTELLLNFLGYSIPVLLSFSSLLHLILLTRSSWLLFTTISDHPHQKLRSFPWWVGQTFRGTKCHKKIWLNTEILSENTTQGWR